MSARRHHSSFLCLTSPSQRLSKPHTALTAPLSASNRQQAATAAALRPFPAVSTLPSAPPAMDPLGPEYQAAFAAFNTRAEFVKIDIKIKPNGMPYYRPQWLRMRDARLVREIDDARTRFPVSKPYVFPQLMRHSGECILQGRRERPWKIQRSSAR